MSFSINNPLNLNNYYTKKNLQSKRIKLPISVKGSQLSNIIDYDKKVGGNIISISYFNSRKYNKNKTRKNNSKDKVINENQSNYYSLFLENSKNNNINNNNKNAKFRNISSSNSCYYSKISLNPLIINSNNNNSKINNKGKNLLSEILIKYSKYSHKPKMKSWNKNNLILNTNNSKNISLKNFKSSKNISYIKQKPILSMENIFQNISSTSNIKKKQKNSVLKINISANSSEKNEKIDFNIINNKTRNKKEKNKSTLFSPNNTITHNIKKIVISKYKKNELKRMHNRTSFFNFSISEIRKRINKSNILNFEDIKIQNKYMITPKNSQFALNDKNKIEHDYYEKNKKREIIKLKPIYNNSKQNILNKIVTKKIKNNNTLYKRHKNDSINIINIFKKKKPKSRKAISKRKKPNISLNKTNSKNNLKLPLTITDNNLNSIKDNKIENKLFKENNLINKYTDDNFDYLFSVVKKLKFNFRNNEKNVFDNENSEYKNYIKKFNFQYNNYFAKYKSNIKIRNKSKYIRKSNSKFFTESTKMKTSSHSKKISYISINTNPRISEFRIYD